MFSLSRLSSLVFLLAIAEVAAVHAQSGRGGRGRRGPVTIDRAATLSIEVVRDGLKIDQTQGATILAALEAYREEQRDARRDRSAFQFLSDEDQQKLRDERQKQQAEMSRKGDETLAALLEPEQLKRLDEIVLQAQLRFSPVPTLRKRVELTEDQLTQLQAVEDDANEKQLKMRGELMKQFQGGGNVDFASIGEIIEKQRRDVEAAALTVLTESQNTSITELKGEEFKIDLRSLMRRRGRGGPGDRRRGGGDRQRGDDGDRGRRQRPVSDD